MNRKTILSLTTVALVASLPSQTRSWGTLTTPVSLDQGQIDQLQGFLDSSAINPAHRTQTRARLGPHPMHQFIVQQAFEVLKRDPAYADGKSGLPDAEMVNAWDGIDKAPGGAATERGPAAVPGVPNSLAPAKTTIGGPSADAERINSGSWNSEYIGAAHYWNPFLNSGKAPEVAAYYFDMLTSAVLQAGADFEPIPGMAANERAHLASYMCHYLADVSSAKHADAIELTADDVRRLDEIGTRWVAAMDDDAIDSPIVTEAMAVLRARTDAIDPAVSAQYWTRAERYMETLRVLRPVWGFTVDVLPTSLRSSVATYLHYLRAREADQPLMAFYGYFDPYYFNGPVLNPTGGNPRFDLTLPLGTHLMWETTPTQYETARTAVEDNKPLLTEEPEKYFIATRPASNYFSVDFESVPAVGGRRSYMQDVVKACSVGAHGANIEADLDFQDEFGQHLRNAIRHVYVALRASITAIRTEATYRRAGEKDFRLRISVTNLAKEAVSLGAFRVLSRQGAELVAPTAWRFPSPSATIPQGGKHVIRVTLKDVPPFVGDPEFYVDITGQYGKTPDSGIRRVKATSGKPLEIVRNPGSSEEVSMETGPLDLGIVFDITGSMSASIRSMIDKAKEIVLKLNKQSNDLRLALCAFRDTKSTDEADKGIKKFDVYPFGKDIDAKVAAMGSWEAKGGGDTPEDQLQGIRNILDMWVKEGATTRMPAKIIVVITDAPAHSPDSFGNTNETIAKLAEEVDPAHIYPIVVGSDQAAIDQAKTLATLTKGQVFTSEKYDEAANMLMKAVSTAAREHAAPAVVEDEEPGGNPGPALIFTGIGLCGLGFVSLAIGFFVRR